MSYQHFRLELLPDKSFVFGSMWRVRNTDVFKIKRIEGGGDEGFFRYAHLSSLSHAAIQQDNHFNSLFNIVT